MVVFLNWGIQMFFWLGFSSSIIIKLCCCSCCYCCKIFLYQAWYWVSYFSSVSSLSRHAFVVSWSWLNSVSCPANTSVSLRIFRSLIHVFIQLCVMESEGAVSSAVSSWLGLGGSHVVKPQINVGFFTSGGQINTLK